MRRHGPFACLIVNSTHHNMGVSQLKAATTMVEVELDQALRCKLAHHHRQARQAHSAYLGCSA